MSSSSYIAGAAAFVVAAIVSVFGKELINGMEIITFLVMSGMLILASIVHLIALKDILGTLHFVINTILAAATTVYIETIPKYHTLQTNDVHVFWISTFLIVLLTIVSYLIFLIKKEK